MKKLIFILILFLLPSCSFIEVATGFGGMMMPVIKIQRTVNKIENICKKECRKNNEYSADWCDCMLTCLNSDDNLNEWNDRGGWWKIDNDFTTTIIENGTVKITLNECKSDSTNTN